MKMLILEDDTEVRKLVIEFLKEVIGENQIEIHWTDSMLGAYALNMNIQFDCQIVDIKVKDGLSWKYIENTKDCIRTLATSAHAINPTKETEGIRFLPKPYTLIEFMKELSYLLNEETSLPEIDYLEKNCLSLRSHTK